LFPLFFGALWLTVASALSRMGGWANLAEYYASDEPISGAQRRFQSMSFGEGLLPVNYSSVVTVAANSEFIELSVLFLFRAGHPRLKIPVAELSVESGKTMLVFPSVKITAAKAPDVKIRFGSGLARWISENSSGNFLPPPQPR
jgi:hypothetical protein